MEGGKTYHCVVRRLKCTKCGKLHTELPRDLTPYKHYVTDAIEDVVDEVTSEQDPLTADGPSNETMKRWRKWMRENYARIQGFIRNAKAATTDEDLPFDFGSSTLARWRSEGHGWLYKVMACVYNFGAFLAPFY